MLQKIFFCLVILCLPVDISTIYADKCISGDCVNGYGTYTFAGHKYVGEWKDNNQHGQGTMTFANGDEKVAQWKNDKYVENIGVRNSNNK